MPKDWKRHKAELERLYIVEKKPLEEVRQLLKDRYGFFASTRAYRMRLDEWGLRKYSTGKDEHAKTLPRDRTNTPNPEPDVVVGKDDSTPVLFPSDSGDDYIQFPEGIRIPKQRLKVRDLLPLIPQCSQYTFEILLVKWQKDGEYLQAMLALLDQAEYRHCFWTRTTVEFPGELLFNLIQRKTADSEQIELMKEFLNPSHMPYHELEVEYDGPEEVRQWLLASYEDSFNQMKGRLSNDEDFLAGFSQRGLECALVRLAEKKLQDIKRRFQAPCYPDEKLDACQEYSQILQSFEGAQIDVDQSWHEYGLLMKKECEKAAHNTIRASTKQADEKQLKYRQLIASYTGIAEEDVDGKLDELLKAEADRPPRSKQASEVPLTSCFLKNAFDSSFSISNEHPVGASDSRTSITRSILKELLAHYLSGVKLEGEIIQNALLPHVPHFYYRNVFDIIPDEVEKRDRIPFATALMTACFKEKLEHSLWPVLLGASFSYQTLESLCAAQSWEQFQSGFKPIEDAIPSLELLWSPAAIKLFSDCMVTLVGERLLFELEKKLNFVFDTRPSMHDKRRQEYVSILRTFVERGLEVDRPWLLSLFDAVECDAPERGGNVDVASEMDY